MESNNTDEIQPQYTREQMAALFGITPALETVVTVVGVTLFVLGVIGNFLIVTVFNAKNLRKSSFSIVFTSLACADTAYLCTGFIRRLILWLNVWQVDIRIQSHPILCKLHIYLTYVSSMLSAWSLVVISIERCISVAFPMKARLICTRKNVGSVLATVLVAILAVNIHYPYGWCPLDEDGTYIKYLNKYLETVDTTLSVIIPFSVSFTSNVVIIVLIKRSRSGRAAMTNNRQTSAEKKKDKVESVTIMLLVTNFTFITATLPYSIYLDVVDWAGTTLDATLGLISYVNYAINFWLYCISGPKFRHEMCRLFRCCK
ncbi:kappa-type opioid receptor-like [Tubulanus polymorphus]|uniref:kappa-type opioid receptor-like n=1 Tax=Tubulanus polymorphus TaxID=672921 RepID=UPI003DA4B8BD